MNKRLNNNDIDALLRNYCKRERQMAFDVEIEREKLSARHTNYGAFAVPLAVVLIFSFAFFQIFGTDKVVEDSRKVPKGFSVSASAAEREPVVLENVEVELCPKDEKGLYSDIVFDNGEVSIEPIWFNMSGDNVETFDYKCENGQLQYIIPQLKEEKLDGDSTITQDDYFKKGRQLKNIPYNSENPEYVFAGWFNLSLDDELESHFGWRFFEETCSDEIREYTKELLKTNDDFNNFFSDTVTITVHYKDGTQETAVIEITVDTWEEDGKIYGNYVLEYV